MTLDEKLGGIAERANPYDKDVTWLIAAFSRCREQRNEWCDDAANIQLPPHYLKNRDDAELLAILEGKP